MPDMPDTPDTPMSDDVKKHLMEREGRIAAEELVEDIEQDMAQIAEAIVKFHEDPEKNGMMTYMLIVLVGGGLHDKIRASTKRFSRRVGRQ